jgi:hypothetical protein
MDLIQFCKDFLEVWTGNRPEKLIEFYSNNAFYRDPAFPNGLVGHDQLFPYFTKLLRRNPDWIWTLVELHPIPQGFIFKWKAEIPVNEIKIIEFGMDLVEIKDGKITRNEVYFDTFNWVKTIRKIS